LLTYFVVVIPKGFLRGATAIRYVIIVDHGFILANTLLLIVYFFFFAVWYAFIGCKVVNG
jgi:hypothetical protein